MAKTKKQKKEILDYLNKRLDEACSVVFAGFDGLGVKENEELRQSLRKEKNEYYVVKKTLLDLALKDRMEGEFPAKDHEGQLAAVFSYEDEVSPAKVLADFQKEHKDKVDFLGGILEEKYVDAGAIKELSVLPSKPELYAKLVGSINSPVSGFVNALAGNLRNLVYALKAIEEKKTA